MTEKLVVVDSSVIVDAFDTNSDRHAVSEAFVDAARNAGYKLLMPAHGFFEIKCALWRIVHIEKREIAPQYNSPEKGVPFQIAHLDNAFLEHYSKVDVPYAKAGDTIFLVIAKKLGLPLVTKDQEMLQKARSCGIDALEVQEAITRVAA